MKFGPKKTMKGYAIEAQVTQEEYKTVARLYNETAENANNLVFDACEASCQSHDTQLRHQPWSTL